MSRSSEQLTLNLDPRLVPDVADHIWAAAFLCGEGHVNLTAGSKGDVRAQAGITNTEVSVLEWYRERWGGAIYRHGKLRSKHDNRRRPIFMWQVLKQSLLLEFLRDIRPYLKFKMAQTDNCIAFLELRVERKARQHRSPVEKARDAEFLQQHRSLNLMHGRRRPNRSTEEVRHSLGLDSEATGQGG